ncbi:MAG TPA: hypothetical protein DD000_00675, partial [Cyanobacteria bacterium UBA11166]|nr:hypothetical protein [Cyanobacteria bacterium UBA11166]
RRDPYERRDSEERRDPYERRNSSNKRDPYGGSGRSSRDRLRSAPLENDWDEEDDDWY